MLTIQGMTEYARVIRLVSDFGLELQGNGGKTVDVSPFSVKIVNAKERVVTDPRRKMNPAFAIVDWLMVMTGSNDANLLGRYSASIHNFSTNGMIDNAYGPRVYLQFARVEQQLKNDPNTRQAVITILQNGDLRAKNPPCTQSVQFRIICGELVCITTMRSNDVVWGFTYDAFVWTMLQEWLAVRLGVGIGQYYHNTGSMHIYKDRDAKIVKAFYDKETKYRQTDYLQMEAMSQCNYDNLYQMIEIEKNSQDGPDFYGITKLPPYWRNLMNVVLAWKFRKDPKLSFNFYGPFVKVLEAWNVHPSSPTY